MLQLVLATRNPDKVKEITFILKEINIEILDLNRFPNCPDVVEDGETLRDNALKKAREVFHHTKILTLADDTGLEVDYLLGAPGVYSSRYAGENATYADNVKKLLKALHAVPPRKRGARFKCVMALVGQGIEKVVEGIVEGKILLEQRGTDGFGYDPIFVPQDFMKTYAEMTMDEKNRISHRANALEKMKEVLSKLGE
jgi:XTP/dITP diphosphohydrolase